MKLKIAATLLMVLGVFLLTGFRTQQRRRPPAEDDRLKGSYRFERDGWIFVHLEGTPEQIGYQHGKLLAKEIEDLLRVLKPFLRHETRRDWNFYRRASEEILWPKI